MSKWSHWNYRSFVDENGDYGFIEVYYDENENILSYSHFMRPGGSSIKDLEFDLEKMAEALNKPTLHINDLPQNK